MNTYILIAAAIGGVYAFNKFKDQGKKLYDSIASKFGPDAIPDQSLVLLNDKKDTVAIEEETREKLAESTVKYSVTPKEKDLSDAERLAQWQSWKKAQGKK
jgi:Fe-S cluster biosynthesis and repair protein YggX